MPAVFRGLFLLGLIFAFLSFFTDWYLYTGLGSQGELQFAWCYNPLIGWGTLSGFVNDESYEHTKPAPIQVPAEAHIIFIIVLLAGGYGVFFLNTEKENKEAKQVAFAYINLTVLILLVYYTILVPCLYFIPNHLYYPFLIYADPNLHMNVQYSIGLGLFLQWVALLLASPHALFLYHTATKFKAESSPEEAVEEIIRQRKKFVDLDGYIAEERAKLRMSSLAAQPENFFEDVIARKEG